MATVIWETETDLEPINAGFPSSLAVSAIATSSTVRLSYSIVSGSLPQGLTLLSNGDIIGSPVQENLGSASYRFTVKAADRTDTVASIRTFTLVVVVPNNTHYSNITAQPFLKQQQRSAFASFINNTQVFSTSSIYRPSDANFGVQRQLKTLVYAGIETVEASRYVAAVNLNNTLKRFTLGDLKHAVAVLGRTRQVVYEVIYLDLIDPLEPDSKQLPLEITHNANTSNPIHKNPSSIGIWRERIAAMPNTVNERNYLPLWMRSIQPNSFVELQFVPAVVLCYCKPGKSQGIIENIKRSAFDFNAIDYTIDRYAIDQVSDVSSNPSYIAFDRFNQQII